MRNGKEEFGIDLPQFSPYELVLAEARYILLYGVIDEESAREVNTKLIAMSIKSPRKPIFLEINSPGGSVADGVTIMNTIQSISSPVITLINGEACSMAGLISIVGVRRLIAPTSYWMGHPMYGGTEGNPQTVKDYGTYLERLENDLTKIFKAQTKLTDEEFKKMMLGQLWLNAEECLTKGIVDSIQELPRLPVKKSHKKVKKSKKGRK